MADFTPNATTAQSAKEHPDFHKAAALVREKRFDAADAACVKLSRHYSRDADLMHLRSVIAYSDKRLHDAIDLVKKALQLRPGNAAMLSDLGNFFYTLGDYEQAEKYLTEALRAAPRFAGAHFNMGNLERAMGNLQRAESRFLQAYQCDPNLIASLFEVIDVQMSSSRLENARRNAEQVAKAFPSMPRAHSTLAKVLESQGEMDAAEQALNKARLLAPADVDLVLEQVSFLSQTGRLPEAVTLLREALKREPRNLRAMNAISRYSKLQQDDPVTKSMQKIAEEGGQSNSDDALIHYALGKVSEDNGHYAKAFEYFCKGAAAKLKSLGNKFFGLEHSYIDLSASFTPNLMSRLKDCGTEDATPIFVLGLPRSGTTLAEQVISSHPIATGAGELEQMEITARWLMQTIGGAKSLGLALDKINPEEISEAASSYLSVLKKYGPDAQRIVDKMPHNFNYIGLIAILFPRATVIHCKRNMLDTALSIFKTNFAGNALRYSYDLDELAGYCRRYQQIMAFWDELLPGRIYHHDYDAMISNQEGQTRALIDACGLEWSDACLSFHKNKQSVKTASVMQVRQPLYKKSSGLSARYGAALDPLREAFDRAGVVY